MKLHRNPKYLKWIRSRNCAVTYSQQDVVAHHLRSIGDAGIGQKPSDYLTMSLTQEKHQKLHNMGEKAFLYENEIDARLYVIASLMIYSIDNGWEKKFMEKMMDVIEELENDNDKS